MWRRDATPKRRADASARTVWQWRGPVLVSGYCGVVARGRTAPIDAPHGDLSAGLRDSASTGAPPATTVEQYDPIAEQQEARRARAQRDGGLSTAQRLQRLHDLCAQLATITPARPRNRAS